MAKKDNVQCSFCGRDKSETDIMIAGLDAHICNICIEQAYQIVLEESTGRKSKSTKKQNLKLKNLVK